MLGGYICSGNTWRFASLQLRAASLPNLIDADYLGSAVTVNFAARIYSKFTGTSLLRPCLEPQAIGFSIRTLKICTCRSSCYPTSRVV